MMKLSKRIPAPFLLDSTKFTRLRAVAGEKVGTITVEGYELRLASSTHVEAHSLDEVLALVNTRRHRVERVRMSLEGGGRRVSVEFDGAAETGITILVEGPDRAWVLDALSAIEEQAERTVQTGPAYKALRGVAIAGLMGLALVALSTTGSDPAAGKRLWLTTQDVAELSKLSSAGGTGAAFLAEFQKRQIKNLEADAAAGGNVRRAVLSKRGVSILLPTGVVVLCLVYLAFACYPRAVFLWGDMEERYDGMLSRRKLVWMGIVVAMAAGVLGNLLTMGLVGAP